MAAGSATSTSPAMTRGTIRGYAVALSLLGLSAAWAAAARDPFPNRQAAPAATQAAAIAADPLIAAVDARAAQLRRRAAEVRQILAGRRAAAARQAAVRVVSTPPVTRTRTS